MLLRMAVTKVMGNNEQLVIDMPSWNPVTGDIVHNNVSEMSELVGEAMQFSDVRSLELHTRMLEGYELQKYCTPAEWTKILDVLEVITGKQEIGTVSRRWQSAIEETADLEAHRQAVHDEMLAKLAVDGSLYDGKDY